ncbi:GNAT family N-acetyltransferase [Endothiovibrio diazotrophicus]
MPHVFNPIPLPALLLARGVAFREMTDDDLPALKRIFVSGRWDEMARLEDWNDAQKTAFLEQQFDLQHHHYATYFVDTDFGVFVAGTEVIGRLLLDRRADDLRIVDIQFGEGWRGRGLGSAVLRQLKEIGRENGQSVSIHVEHLNPALRLYNREGFLVTGQEGPYWLMHWFPEGHPGWNADLKPAPLPDFGWIRDGWDSAPSN